MAYTKTFWYLKFSSWSAVTSWAASNGYAAGQWVRQLATPTSGQERCFVCIFAGTSGLAEPAWNLTRGQKTSTDGTVIWQECTGIPGPCGDVTNTSSWTVVKNTAVSLGQVIKDVAATTYFICTTSGTTGNGSEPSWNTTAGQTTNDNTVVWTSIGAISGYSTPFQYPHARMQAPYGTGFMLAGETCYESNNHTETQSSAMTLGINNGTQSAPLNFMCVNDAVAPPTATATTASVSTTGASAIGLGTGSGYCYWYGINFSAGSGASSASITLGASGFSGETNIFDTCGFTLNNTSSSSRISFGGSPSAPSQTQCLNPSFVFGATSQSINIDASGGSIIGGTIAATGSIPSTLITTGANHNEVLLIRDTDLSSVVGTLMGVGTWSSGNLTLENCKTGSGLTPKSGSFLGTNDPYIRMHNCDNGATNYHYYYATAGGVIQQSTSIYNNAGATNGITNESWQIVTTTVPTFAVPFVTEEIAIWNDNSGSAKTATIQLTCGTTLNNNDIWLEIEYPSSSSAPLGGIVSTRMAWFGTPTALTTSAATWTGALANLYKIAASFTPRMKGPIKARIYVAKPNLTVNLDPLITIA